MIMLIIANIDSRTMFGIANTGNVSLSLLF
jgi:hypothetical protein